MKKNKTLDSINELIVVVDAASDADADACVCCSTAYDNDGTWLL